MRGNQFQLFPKMMSDNRFANKLLPPAFCFAVVHDQIGMAQFAGCAETQRLAIESCIKHNCHIAQRAVGDRHWLPAHRVVDNFVPGQDPQRIGPRVTIDRQADNRFAINQV